jgi:hypothetical protein
VTGARHRRQPHGRALTSEENGKRRLAGGLPKTASWISCPEPGLVEVELYDFSEAAHDAFGNDVAYRLRIETLALAPALGLAEDSDDDRILDEIANRFTSYHAVKRWLEENGVPSSTVFESWA